MAFDALASAAFIEGGVSSEDTQATRDFTEQRKRELLQAVTTHRLHQIQEPAPACVHRRKNITRPIDADHCCRFA